MDAPPPQQQQQQQQQHRTTQHLYSPAIFSVRVNQCNKEKYLY